MMMYRPDQELQAGLCSVGEGQVALQSTDVNVLLRNLFEETVVTQVYKNLESKPIEAVYTFPLASRAVLLGLEVIIGSRTLQGVVVEKSQAEERYEEAITNEDAAIMLEQVRPGLYTMNVGNILAGEQIRVAIRYGQVHEWQENTLRFFLPTTIAPRYGSQENAGFQPHQIPDTGLLATNKFQVKVSMFGKLAEALLDCPTHQIVVDESSGTRVVSFASGQAFMDRDFVLNIRLPEGPQGMALVDTDFDNGFVALASLVPKVPTSGLVLPRSIKIIVDCSASMNGDSIAQARQAISDILVLLRPEDHFNIIMFGSTCKQCFDRQVPADLANITKIRRMLRSLNADMGGTEMRQALQTAVQIPGLPMPHDVFLITDGQVWEEDNVINEMKQTGHRFFTVGVGSSVAEGFVRELARATGGVCELVVPNEAMAEKITRHFKRIFSPRIQNATVSWPLEPLFQYPEKIGPVYDGDTVNIFAFFDRQPEGVVSLSMPLANEQITLQSIVLDGQVVPGDIPGSLTRMARNEILKEKDVEDMAADAVCYQLISRCTNFLVVDAKADVSKTGELPVLRKVPQMLAAGWGGAGTVCQAPNLVNEPVIFSKLRSSSAVRFSVAPSPEELRRRRQHTTPEIFIYNCNSLHNSWLRPVLCIASFKVLDDCDLPERIAAAVRQIVNRISPQTEEEIAVLAFLIALLQAPAGDAFSRNTKRAINKARKTMQPDGDIIKALIEAFAQTTRTDWGSEYPYIEDSNDENE